MFRSGLSIQLRATLNPPRHPQPISTQYAGSKNDHEANCDGQSFYFFRSFSMSAAKDEGEVRGPQRPTTVPSFPTKNLAKFHPIKLVSPEATLRN